MHTFPLPKFPLSYAIDLLVIPPALATNDGGGIAESTVDIMHRGSYRCDIGAMTIEKIDASDVLTVQAVDNVFEE